MGIRRTSRHTLTIALLALVSTLPAAWGVDRTRVMDYYRQELWNVPVLVFCSGDPKALGPKFLARANVEYLPLTEYEKRKDAVGKIPTVFLVAREDLMEIPAAYGAFIPHLANLKPNHLYVYCDTPVVHQAYKTPDGKKVANDFNCTRVVIVAPTVEWLDRAVAVFHTFPDFLDKPKAQKTMGLADPLMVETRVVCAVAEKGRGALSAYLAGGPRPELGQALAPGAPGFDAAVLRAALAEGYHPPVCILVAPTDLGRYEKWLSLGDEVHLYTYEELARLPSSARGRVPHDLSSLKPNQTLAVRRERAGAGAVTCFAAPTAPVLVSVVDRYRAATVPAVADVRSVPDFRGVRTVLITGGGDVPGVSRDHAALFERELSDALSNARVFEGVRSGMTEGSELKTVLQAIRLEMSGLTNETRDNLRIANADLLALAAVTRVSGRTSYRQDPPKLVTPEEPTFAEKPPEEPRWNAKTSGLFGYKDRYPKGKEDPRYIQEHGVWVKEYAEWQRRKQDHEGRLAGKQCEWEVQVHQRGEAVVEATVRLFDLRTGAVVWASPVEGRANAEVPFERLTVTAAGQGKKPAEPRLRDADLRPPEAMVDQGLERAVASFVEGLRKAVLVPGDLAQAGPTSPLAPAETPGTATPSVTPSGSEEALGTLLDVLPTRVVIKGGQRSGLKAGDVLIAVVDVEVRRDKDGAILDTIERAIVVLKVLEAYQNTSDCAPLKAEDMAKLKPDQPVRRPRPGETP